MIENPVRRRIIKRLSQEPSYALQISKELGLGQPLVAKHLGIMEGSGFVVSSSEDSPAGPQRKRYALARSISITMDIAPNLFIERGVAFEGQQGRGKVAGDLRQLRTKMRDALEARDDRERLSLISEILDEVDGRIHAVEEDRLELLKIRNQAMHEAGRIAGKVDGLDKRRVLFHILDEHDRQAESVSQSLNLREQAAKAILEELERDYFS